MGAGGLTCDDETVRRGAGYSGKPLVEKLGVRPGMRESVLGISDDGFVAELAARGADVSTRRRARSDVLIVRFTRASELPRLRTHRAFIATDGAVWAVW